MRTPRWLRTSTDKTGQRERCHPGLDHHQGESVSLVRKEFPGHRNLHTVSFRIRFPLDLHIEIDRAHDAVTELLFNQRLPGCPIGLYELLKTVDERVCRWKRLLAANHDREVLVSIAASASLRLRSVEAFPASVFVKVICPSKAAVYKIGEPEPMASAIAFQVRPRLRFSSRILRMSSSLVGIFLLPMLPDKPDGRRRCSTHQVFQRSERIKCGQRCRPDAICARYSERTGTLSL